MSGEGHRNWVSGVTFHPQGTMLATGAGDNTVKIWDFLQVGLCWGRGAGARGVTKAVCLGFVNLIDDHLLKHFFVRGRR